MKIACEEMEYSTDGGDAGVADRDTFDQTGGNT